MTKRTGGSKKSTRRGPGSGCYTCGGDHLARDCPTQHEDIEEEAVQPHLLVGASGPCHETKKKMRGRKFACFNCGGPHHARDCPEGNRDDAKQLGEGAGMKQPTQDDKDKPKNSAEEGALVQAVQWLYRQEVCPQPFAVLWSLKHLSKDSPTTWTRATVLSVAKESAHFQLEPKDSESAKTNHRFMLASESWEPHFADDEALAAEAPETIWKDMQRILEAKAEEWLDAVAHLEPMWQPFELAVWLHGQSGEMKSLSVGRILGLVRRGLREKVLGKSSSRIVLYKDSDDAVKAYHARVCHPFGVREGELYVKTWQHLRWCLSKLLADDKKLHTSIVKARFREKFGAELSETAFGHQSLMSLLKDEEHLGDVISVEMTKTTDQNALQIHLLEGSFVESAQDEMEFEVMTAEDLKIMDSCRREATQAPEAGAIAVRISLCQQLTDEKIVDEVVEAGRPTGKKEKPLDLDLCSMLPLSPPPTVSRACGFVDPEEAMDWAGTSPGMSTQAAWSVASPSYLPPYEYDEATFTSPYAAASTAAFTPDTSSTSCGRRRQITSYDEMNHLDITDKLGALKMLLDEDMAAQRRDAEDEVGWQMLEELHHQCKALPASRQQRWQRRSQDLTSPAAASVARSSLLAGAARTEEYSFGNMGTAMMMLPPPFPASLTSAKAHVVDQAPAATPPRLPRADPSGGCSCATPVKDLPPAATQKHQDAGDATKLRSAIRKAQIQAASRNRRLMHTASDESSVMRTPQRPHNKAWNPTPGSAPTVQKGHAGPPQTLMAMEAETKHSLPLAADMPSTSPVAGSTDVKMNGGAVPRWQLRISRTFLSVEEKVDESSRMMATRSKSSPPDGSPDSWPRTHSSGFETIMDSPTAALMMLQAS
eukprot:CAMPEP_0178427836 /NCGR_PEP_ID=MMETSP0689_2-20121128/29953_1 /TAXON_ID=160604 /ORGANISM="Amphidinium massartii, Strain CS-259" /LENGTH=878 /DNA_ID=CAMNT_0020049561 /DNA_START=56 /DNA_END=2693 /DNA_ORIENTATION=-